MYATIEKVGAAAPKDGCKFRAQQAAMRLAAMWANQAHALDKAILLGYFPFAEIEIDAAFAFDAAHCGYWGAW